MVHLFASLLFTGAFLLAVTVIIAMFQSHGERMIAALRMDPVRRRAAPWRTPPRRMVREGASRVTIRRPLRAAA